MNNSVLLIGDVTNVIELQSYLIIIKISIIIISIICLINLKAKIDGLYSCSNDIQSNVCLCFWMIWSGICNKCCMFKTNLNFAHLHILHI